jgi:phosphoribosyl 1,2-cyclic phosphate phosphodiesterase
MMQVMTNRQKADEARYSLKLVFLGSSGAIQVPAFFCSCSICEAARRDPKEQRTRASVAVIGQETVVIDASPDMELQLERCRVQKVDRIFITHWHYDHVSGLGELGEAKSCAKWPPVEVYGTRAVAEHFEQELAHMKRVVNVHVVSPGDTVELAGAVWEVVKTTHTEDSVGYIVRCPRSFAYLVDGVVPPPETVERLKGLDLLVLEATLDELDEDWTTFSLQGAVDFWRQTGVPECILTHLSCHSWRAGRLIAGLSATERRDYEKRTPGLRFAYDGMHLQLSAQ